MMKHNTVVSSSYPIINRLPALFVLLLLVCSLLPTAVHGQDAGAAEKPEVTVLSQTITPTQVSTTIRINVQQDSFLSSLQSNTNFGSSSQLRLGWSSAGFDAMRML